MKKVLRAIGGFFAKIGRWIANTAWVQPLLIVGGIFAIIFSIPYIKKGIENAIASKQVVNKEAYYLEHAISLVGAETDAANSQADRLFSNLLKFDEESINAVKAEFGEKFLISFVERDCTNCETCQSGIATFESKFYSEYGLNVDKDTQKTLPNFRFYSIMVDTMVSNASSPADGKFYVKFIVERYQSLLDALVTDFGENAREDGNYYLYNNISSSQKDAMCESITAFAEASDKGIETPTTFMIDLTEDGLANHFNTNGISAILFNFTTLMTGDVNDETKAQFLRDCWTYSNAFSFDGKEVNY